MRLQTIEIKGFKSFAKDTVIHFNDNVIGIVGPNGSGKSNVIDAIRWVLGEQKTTELRLDQMSNVLFNGTSKRKATNIARVAITFQNDRGLLPTDFHSVTISRTLDRGGSSEYRLNDVPCRLKDIHALLVDTGIGSDSYAIIALGMVDDILSDKEHSRRRMLEQAAGITKFKQRKKETLQKLQLTNDDLNRVEDLLAEIESNLKSLEKQAKRTQKFLEYKEQYKEISVSIARMQAHKYKEDYKRLDTAIQKELDQYRTVEIEIQSEEAALEKHKAQHLNEEAQLSEHQKQLSATVHSLRSAESSRSTLQQQQEFLQTNRTETEKQIESQISKQSQISIKIGILKERLEAESSKVNVLKEILSAKESNLQSAKTAQAQHQSSLDNINQSLRAAQQKQFELEKQKAVDQSRMDNLIREKDKEEKDFEQQQITFKDLELRIAADQRKLEDLEFDLNQLETKENQRLQLLESTEEKRQKIQLDLDQLKRSLSSKKHEFDLTKSLVENLEGFPESIKFLSAKKDWQKQPVLLSDILYCDPQYRVALEHYLEPYLNYFVVPDHDTAIQAIQLLEQSQKGKANFFILSAYRDEIIAVENLPGRLSALEVLKVDDAYLPLLSQMLKNVSFLLDPKVAADQVDLSILSDQDVLLHLNGSIVFGKRVLSGGSVGLFEGKKIGRKKNLEVLEQDIKVLHKDIFELESSLAATIGDIKQIKHSSYVEAIRLINRQIADQRNTYNQKMASHQSLAAAMQQFEERRLAKTTELESIQLRMTEHSNFWQAVVKEVDEFAAVVNSGNLEYQELSAKVQQLNAEFNQSHISLLQQQNLADTIRKDLDYAEHELQEVAHLITSANQRIEENTNKLQENKLSLEKIVLSIQSLIEEKSEREKQLTASEQVFFEARNTAQKMENTIREKQRQLLQQQGLINQMKDKFSEAKYNLSSISERLRIEFDIQLNELINLPELSSEESEADLQHQSEKLKQRIASLGDINPMALEAYQEMKERFDFISKQRDDIRDAQTSLLDTISEIEQTARAKFLYAFEEVRKNFIHVFRSLFTEEDECDLVLEDPERPLESEIGIIAKPKGKRPQTIHQLSGGEKTLTAIALLFSFYLLKPAPFCIFDEVDAPLDDSNIEKFNKIIMKFSADSQFVVVTHNKGTMAAMDMIYGVYMEEEGVSSLSPVDFRKFEHTGLFETVEG